MRYRAEIKTWVDDDAETQVVEGEAAPVAAWLRAIADQLDPPKRPMRSLAQDADTSMKLKGL